ncbi:isocitrate lyase/PEP mutase family protein [Clostridium saccharoperbutylacetonicum]|uniref:isocitrate lyase/PEP mutase family protein n=1 Tax=Clostridium saccharoperbutylacetonicum TaxID=36745 RepID=UPI00156F6259|nr:isocitrate lyase/phosphoenolpyruvate mutase family protein [Clostridium saccharoperbutylacetonicum]NSB30225.1 2-methylisocitrate lyase-like PEP mutase family enzyme [Clostridium saccharoperbutylacetonicum]
MDRDKILKQLLNSSETLIMPDAFDPISAKIIEYAGFSAVQCSGYSYAISKGYKHEDDIDLKTNLDITKSIVDTVNIPVMADGEDGYGEGQNFKNTIKEFINTGVSGINIEDQVHNMECKKLRIIDELDMLNKIKDANSIKFDLGKNDFIINARTDALLSLSNRKEAQKLAIDRANKYLEAGADLCFVAYVKTLDEVKLLSREINGPISIAAGLQYNIQEFSINDCIELGIARVSLPTVMILNSIESMVKKLKEIKSTGNFNEIIKDTNLLYNSNLLEEILNGKNKSLLQ